MAGIYIHIPFCRQACSYCNFHFSVSLKNKDAFVNALLKEIDLRKDYLAHEKIETIYFGGGTPSLLSSDEVNRIVEKLNAVFPVAPDAEITLEANPDDLTGLKIRELKATPVNRFSIGIQSFHDDDLHFLNRAHHSQQAESSVRLAQEAGFENITIDLIYGIPMKEQEAKGKRQEKNNSSFVPAKRGHSSFEYNLAKLAKLGIPHFSAYCLTIEPKTILEKMIREKKSPDVNEADAAHQFEMLMDFAEENGYEHYEISNFAKAGFYSRHNTSYWTGKKYLGLGPSAHSYDGVSRQWNIASNARYIQSLEKGELPFEKETLSENDRFNEYIMLSLRTKWGVDKKIMKQIFQEEKLKSFEKTVSNYLADDWLVCENEKITLSRKGKLIADRIISGLFET